MNTEPATVGTVLSALHQAYYAMYAALIRKGALDRGEIAEVLRDPGTGEFVGEDAAAWLLGMAKELDQIDAGGTVRFQVIEGGRQNEE